MPLTSEGRQVAAEILEHLGVAHEPVREDFLHERVGSDVDPDLFIAVLEQLLTQGAVEMHVDHDLPVNRPGPAEPFQPRFWFPARH
jgi:hypothetical protein